MPISPATRRSFVRFRRADQPTTYDSFARVRIYTNSEGWTATYDYDAADRVAKVTYPDGTAEISTYNRLDLASYRDRQGRRWSYTYDANRRRTAMIDPAGQQTLYGYNQRGQLTSLTDPMTNVTGWAYDVQGRLTTKTYPDTSTVTYTYETTTSRLKSVTDALGQVKTYAYGIRYVGSCKCRVRIPWHLQSQFVAKVHDSQT